jgi:hypothetical protein
MSVICTLIAALTLFACTLVGSCAFRYGAVPAGASAASGSNSLTGDVRQPGAILIWDRWTGRWHYVTCSKSFNGDDSRSGTF